ncbi:type III secretion protein HrpQ [Pantoea sp. Al-1710]|uniref:Type III secretion protein HrpQ n=1 Tax=Candidatus Pantoea communis TaxID=2608354 RepID=A0ABX0RJ50_9GAMM|nr:MULTISPECIES: FHA domain-containing protein [Pantoea]NIG12932.1 type III secretion protein HrpQ [Pantoea sp. Cy-640]NIG17367.1 type III secretion protein HrpQ [Pantoea communis]
MFELRVLNGLHEGATLPLSGENWQLGNHEESDLQLCDADILAKHATLSKRDETWHLAPNEGNIYLAEGGRVNDTLTLEPNQPFMLSGVWLVVSESDTPWTSSSLIPINADGLIETAQPKPERESSRFPAWFKPSVVMLIVLGVVIVVSWILSASKTTNETPDNRIAITDAESLRAVLEKKLEDRDLNKLVTITGDEHGLTLNGELTENQLEIMSRLMSSLHDEYKVSLPLINATALKVLRLPFRIVQITAGKGANVVIEDGRRLFIGDKEQGFTLSKITKDTVEFTGSENISVKW